jgi:hypothetical protein
MPDGSTITVAGSTSTSSNGPPSITVSRGGTERTFEVGAEEACIQLTDDGKRAVTLNFDGKATVFDVQRLLDGGSLEEATLAVLPGTLTSAFPIGDGSAIVTSANEGVVNVWREDDTGAWQRSELYRGDYPVFYAEPDGDAGRLLIIESTGGGDTRGFLYSVEAGQRWLELGTDYKWFGEAFAEDGGIASGARGVQRYIDLPPLGALVAETAARVNPAGS